MPVPQQNASSNKYSLDKFYTEEIVIGLCGPIGVDLPSIATHIKDDLRSYHYDSVTIKMSQIIVECVGEIDDTSLERKERLIEEGNNLRRDNKRGSFLAEKAIDKIFRDRIKQFPDKKFVSRRKCFIIDSIKNVSEAKKFREIYGESFYLIGAFSSEKRKLSNLTRGNKALIGKAEHLIQTDYNQKGDFGQQVSKVFQTADYFLRMDGDDDLDNKLLRILKLILGAEIITPNHAENAMFAAASAARNSACLSRQVGAAILSDKGNIISTGWNDAPKFGGGTYQFGAGDHRCFNYGNFCRNDHEKKFLIEHIVDDLLNAGAITLEKKEIAYTAISKSRVSDLIEFSRAVHAEMLAILNAANSTAGLLKDSVLYCTTYPCHSCARHIVAAGIKEVYFIEPYAKSRAVSLHEDAITEHENEGEKLKILAYEGVAPNRYLDFFSIKHERKNDDGAYQPLPKEELKPQVDKIFESIPVLEGMVVRGLMPEGGGDGDGENQSSGESAA